jgi:hypothetical protein
VHRKHGNRSRHTWETDYKIKLKEIVHEDVNLIELNWLMMGFHVDIL